MKYLEANKRYKTGVEWLKIGYPRGVKCVKTIRNGSRQFPQDPRKGQQILEID
jgi:hypothetical protein